ncbi:MAG TPA: glycosyltransferase family 87 protein [Verrucomicrobiae bacterium]|nr:glycosyltransferase family 87 protein [Verrucomicrobiae bacterium]
MTAAPPAAPAHRPGAARILLIVILVHTAGVFAYSTLWRGLFAADFDVNDFKAYAAGATALAAGRPDMLYPDPATLNLGVLPDQPWVKFAMDHGIPHPSAYIYPPFLAVVLRPLAALPYHRANQVWFLLNAALFAASVGLLVTWRRGAVAPEAAGAIAFASMNFYPTFRALQCGQVGMILLFLTAAALWSLERERDGLAGTAIAIAAAIKLTPAILIAFFFLAGRHRAGRASLVAGTACAAVSIAGAGFDNHVVFLRDFLPTLSRGAATFANQSLTGFLARLATGATMNAYEFLEGPPWLGAASRASSAAVLLASLALGARAARRGRTAEGLSLVVLGSLLASPISWEHHFIAALVPIAVLLVLATESGTVPGWRAGALLAGYALIAVNGYDLVRRYFPYRLGRLAISQAFFGGGALWLLLAAGRRSDPPASIAIDAAVPGGSAARAGAS